MTSVHGMAVAADLWIGEARALGCARCRWGVGGGEVTPAEFSGYTSTKLQYVEWLEAVTGWPQPRGAAGRRLHKEAAFLLRRGRIGLDDPASDYFSLTVKDIPAVIATSKAKLAVLPWQDAPRVCKTTAKVVAGATRGWHRTSH